MQLDDVDLCYLKFGCKVKGIRKSEFVSKTQFHRKLKTVHDTSWDIKQYFMFLDCPLEFCYQKLENTPFNFLGYLPRLAAVYLVFEV